MSTMPSNETWLMALDESIQHWENNLQRALNDEGLKTGDEYCACCKIADDSCDGCPIYWGTGKVNCEGTPYFSVQLNLEHRYGIGRKKDLIDAIKGMITTLKNIKTKLEASISPTETQG